MKIALLGAGGFIGSHLAEHILERTDHEIIGLDMESEKLDGIPGTDGPRFSFFDADIRASGELVDDIVGDSDVVVDLIAHANPSLYVEVPLDVVHLNFDENLKIAELCMKHDKRLIQYSSCEVYGKPIKSEGVWAEDEADLVYGPVHKHRWIYACAKQLLERVLFAHGEAGDLEFTSIRPFNFIGPRVDYLVPPETMGGPRVFAHYMSALLGDGPMYLVNGGEVHRTFTGISDANEAFQAVLDHPEQARNQAYNVGNPDNHIKIKQLADLMRELFEELTGQPARGELVDVSGEEFYGSGYEDTDRLRPDISKLQALGWEPQVDIETTLTGAMKYYLDKSGSAVAS